MSMEPKQAADPTAAAGGAWWGTYRIPIGSAGRWRIGPMTICIERLREEWRISAEMDENIEDPTASVELPADCGDLLQRAKVTRFGVSGRAETITLTPMLADRPIVTKPEKPFYISAHESVIVYVGSPIWVRIEFGDPPVMLGDFPIIRPSDTWFGPNTYIGELCYAGRTACRLQLTDLPIRAHRAVTAVTVENRSSAPLLLEHMKLPVLYLSLFHSKSGVFWTRDIKFRHEAGAELASLRYGARVPAHAGDAVQVSAPRQEVEENFAMRVFSSLFSR